jgi:hypothetical protein
MARVLLFLKKREVINVPMVCTSREHPMIAVDSEVGGHRDELLENWQVEFDAGQSWPSPYYEDDGGGVQYKAKADGKRAVAPEKKSVKRASSSRAPGGRDERSRKNSNTRGKKA